MTTLAADLARDANRADVAAAYDRDEFLAQAGEELLLVTAGGQTTGWTIERGYLGTSRSAHASGADITPVRIAVQTSEPSAPPPSQVGEAVSVDVLKVTVALTNAQIKALGTGLSPIEIVPAPGPGKFIAYVTGAIWIDTTADTYGGIGAGASMRISIDGDKGGSVPLADASQFEVTSLLSNGFRWVQILPANLGAFSGFSANNDGQANQFEDLPLVFNIGGNGGAFTGGHASNTGAITVIYAVVDL